MTRINVGCQIFQVSLFPKEKVREKRTQLLEGERALENLTPRFSFAINFHSQPQIEKQDHSIYLHLKSFSVVNLFLFEQHFPHELFCQIFKNMFHERNCSPRQLSQGRRQLPSSPREKSTQPIFQLQLFFLVITLSSQLQIKNIISFQIFKF